MADGDMSDVLSECSDTSCFSDFDTKFQSLNIDISNGPPINIDNFKIVHYNINSLLAPDRLDQLTNICRILKIDVLILSESKLDETFPNNLISIPGYHEPIRHDRIINGRNGGGTVIYIADHIIFQHKPELQSEKFEHLWVDVRLDKLFTVSFHG